MLDKYIRTIRLDVQYDGTQYVGWQRQAKGSSIQSKLEEALSKVANENVVLFVAGRTDTGVHARKQMVSMSLVNSKTPIEAFVFGTNALLPPDIRVTASYEERIDFRLIQRVKSKTYRYYFRYSPIENVFLKTVWQTKSKFQLSKMKKALRYLVGEHDFSCFQTHGRETKTGIRKIYKAIIRKDREGVYFLEIEANGFLRHMVRSIMGTIMDVGVGKIEPRVVRSIVASKDRKKAGQTAPPHALFLWEVQLKSFLNV